MLSRRMRMLDWRERMLNGMERMLSRGRIKLRRNYRLGSGSSFQPLVSIIAGTPSFQIGERGKASNVVAKGCQPLA